MNKKELSKNDLSKKELSKNELSKNELSKNDLSKNDLSNGINYEYPIEKFIDMKSYKFNQDYLGIVKNILVKENDKMINILSKMLNNEINGNKLSIRQSEKRINNIKSYFDLNNDFYSKLKYFALHVWGDFETIKEKLRLDLFEFLKIQKENYDFIKKESYYNKYNDITIIEDFSKKDYNGIIEWIKYLSEYIISLKKFKYLKISNHLTTLNKIYLSWSNFDRYAKIDTAIWISYRMKELNELHNNLEFAKRISENISNLEKESAKSKIISKNINDFRKYEDDYMKILEAYVWWNEQIRRLCRTNLGAQKILNFFDEINEEDKESLFSSNEDKINEFIDLFLDTIE